MEFKAELHVMVILFCYAAVRHDMRTCVFFLLCAGLDADPDVLATAIHLAHSIGYSLNIAVGKKMKEVPFSILRNGTNNLVLLALCGELASLGI